MKFPRACVALSIQINNATGGPKDWSLCARWWEGKRNGNKFCKVGAYLADSLFFFDKQHCRKAWLMRTHQR